MQFGDDLNVLNNIRIRSENVFVKLLGVHGNDRGVLAVSYKLFGCEFLNEIEMFKKGFQKNN